MHYPDIHRFTLPFTPTQRRDSEGRFIEQWYIPISGLHGHYLYSNGDVSHSFNYDLTNDGYDWMYSTLSSALDAMVLYRVKAENESVPAPHPSWEVTEYIEFLEPRAHVSITHKWVVTNFIPKVQETVHHIYLHDNGKTITRAVITGDNGSTALFASQYEAQKALDAYRAKWNILTESQQTLPDNIVHKLLEPQIISDTFLLWEVISADNPTFALSDSNSIVHVAYRAEFDTFQSAFIR